MGGRMLASTTPPVGGVRSFPGSRPLFPVTPFAASHFEEGSPALLGCVGDPGGDHCWAQ
jgi:hypothetical protein